MLEVKPRNSWNMLIILLFSLVAATSWNSLLTARSPKSPENNIAATKLLPVDRPTRSPGTCRVAIVMLEREEVSESQAETLCWHWTSAAGLHTQGLSVRSGPNGATKHKKKNTANAAVYKDLNCMPLHFSRRSSRLDSACLMGLGSTASFMREHHRILSTSHGQSKSPCRLYGALWTQRPPPQELRRAKASPSQVLTGHKRLSHAP